MRRKPDKWIDGICKDCGNRFSKRIRDSPATEKQRSYCTDCIKKHPWDEGISRKIQVVCAICGKTKMVIPSRANEYKNHYCSRECWNKRVPWNKGKPWSNEVRQHISEGLPDMSGANNPQWKGGRHHEEHGYIIVWTPEGNKFEHRLVMEQKLGRKLLPGEQVHHINEIKDDNRPENLQLVDIGDHARHHSSGERNWQTKIGIETVVCKECSKEFKGQKSHKRSFCSPECYHAFVNKHGLRCLLQ